ncbi:MAG: copper-binding protein [Pirellulales bacterium]|nr:copper-binding protein [Pirellulales bacterium]
MNHVRTALVLGAALLLAGCSRAPVDQARQYEIRGKITALDAAGPTVTIDHEDIPGLMQAMEMEFKASGSGVLAGLQVGDAVQGHLEARDGEQVIVDLQKR